MDVFHPSQCFHFQCPLSDDDMDTLFSNIDEVIEASEGLLWLLESATDGKDFRSQLIGPCFLQMKEEMQRVYAQYCHNYDEVNAIQGKVCHNSIDFL